MEIDSQVESRVTALEARIRGWRNQAKNEKKGKNSWTWTTVWSLGEGEEWVEVEEGMGHKW